MDVPEDMSMDMTFMEMLKEGAAVYGASLDDGQVAKLLKYKELLVEWNQKINLTAIEEDRDIIIKHFIDSFTILPYLKTAGAAGQAGAAGKSGATGKAGQVAAANKPAIRVIDVGTGAGFPGLPVQIVSDFVETVLLDSLDKRVKFLNLVISELGLKNISAIHGRAEDMGVSPVHREKYDVSVARAVASLPVLLEYCLPFVKTGGVFIAMKGSSTDEVGESSKALELLGGEIEKVEELTLPYSDMKRNIIIVKKLRQTPSKYPRKSGKPSKEPLI